MARKKNNIIDLQNIDFSNLSFDVDTKTTKEQDEEREQDKIFSKEYFEDFEFNARYIKPKKCFFKTTAIKHDNAKKLAAELPPSPNFRYDVIVSGSFIFGDFIHAYLTKHHLQAKRCIISTLGMNEANVDALAALLRANYILDLELFVSVYFFSLKRHDIVPYIYRVLDADEFKGRFQLSVSHIHTKTFQIETSDGRKMIMQGSANLCSSANIEQFIFEENPEVYDFYANNFEKAKCKVITGETTAEQLRRIILKDNSAYGEWDFDELANEWDEALIRACAIEIPTMDEAKMEEEAEEDNFNPDDIEQEPTVKRGDIWQLGDHRLLCGDCTDLDTVLKFMQGRHADLVLTDPPYNVDYSEKTRALEKKRGQKKATRDDAHNTIANDKMSDAAFREFLTKFYNVSTEVCKPGGAFYVWHSMCEQKNFRDAAPKNLHWSDTLIWNKNHFCLTRKDYQLNYEPCLYFTKDGRAHYFCPQRNLVDVIELAERFDIEKATKDEMKDLLGKILALPTTVIDCERPMASKEHPTMKPVKLFGMLIKNSSRVGEIVFDPFGGSGTTIVAAEQLNRVAYSIELEPHYCDVIIARWEKLTGRQAVKLGNINEMPKTENTEQLKD